MGFSSKRHFGHGYLNFNYLSGGLYYDRLVAKPWMTCALTFNRLKTDKNSSTILIYYFQDMVIYTEQNGIDEKESLIYKGDN
jgi:hypothetical protein